MYPLHGPHRKHLYNTSSTVACVSSLGHHITATEPLPSNDCLCWLSADMPPVLSLVRIIEELLE
jgi:hypothetical protein